GFSQVSSNYTLSGAPGALTTAISQLLFAPTENRLPVGAVETTTFTIAVSDSIVAVANNSTKVAATSINDLPTVTGVSATRQFAATGNSITPFATATIIDPDR